MELQNQDLMCCRACLATDCKLFHIHDNKLADVFTRISGTPVFKDRLPQYVCIYCHTLLLKCASFRSMCLRTQVCLVPELLKGEISTESIRGIDRLSHRLVNLNSCPVQIINNIENKPLKDIKREPETETIVEPEIETNIDTAAKKDEYKLDLDVAETDEANTNIVNVKKSGLKMDILNKNYDFKIKEVIDDEDDATYNTMKKRKLKTSAKKEVETLIGNDDINNVGNVKTSKSRVRNEKVNKETKRKNIGVKKKKFELKISDECKESCDNTTTGKLKKIADSQTS